MPDPASKTQKSLLAALALNRGELDPARLAAMLRQLAADDAKRPSSA
jgi:hypothetical protein